MSEHYAREVQRIAIETEAAIISERAAKIRLLVALMELSNAADKGWYENHWTKDRVRASRQQLEYELFPEPPQTEQQA